MDRGALGHPGSQSNQGDEVHQIDDRHPAAIRELAAGVIDTLTMDRYVEPSCGERHPGAGLPPAHLGSGLGRGRGQLPPNNRFR